MGSLDRTLIRGVVRRHIMRIRYCYERELKGDPSLSGKVAIGFDIAADGRVTRVEVKESSLGSEALEQCIAGQFTRMTFPKPKGGGLVRVTYPLLFSNGD